MSFAEKNFEFLSLLGGVKSVTVAARELGINRNTGYSWARAAGIGSTRVEHPGKAEYLALRDDGLSQRRAAERVGVHPRSSITPDQMTIGTMALPAPGSIRHIPEMINPRMLLLPEREQIADLRRLGWS